jgi:exo-1,4-beta-D-glucosaminidase
MKSSFRFLFFLVLIVSLCGGLHPIVESSAWARVREDSGSTQTLKLVEGWRVQSSAQVKEQGEVLSTPKFTPSGWYPASIPATVLSVLVENKIYPDPYYGLNLRSIPGTTYPIGRNFSNLDMPPDSPFRVPWWYRGEFKVPKSFQGKQIWLNFEGINFRANIWLNGRQIASSEQVAGAYRLYEFNITDAALTGRANVVAVEVFPPQANDLAITWVDWNPAPPDKDMGIWRGVYLTASGPVAVRYPQVITNFDLPSVEVAHLTVNAELRNGTPALVKGTLRGQIGKIQFSQEVELAPRQVKQITFTPENFPQLSVSNPRLWWPAQLGPQNLYTLSLEFASRGKVSDRQTLQFGIREITSEMSEMSYRIFKINGQRILIRGAGWAPDMLLRSSPERQEAEIRYVKDMNLNTIRFEGKLEDEHFLEVCDREGILVLAGWCCCDYWERWRNWKAEDYTISAESLKDQVRRLRSHPCLLDWLNGSDNPPVAKVEQTYVDILKEYHWPNPYQSSATARPTSLTGKTGLKMTGPYEYVAPSYWLEDKERGGAHGFNTETSPGPAVPPLESLRKFIPEDHLWPINDYWNFHAGGGGFRTLDVFTRALNERYGTATSLEDYLRKAQVMAYEGERAMFEAYGRNKYISTGVIQWMLNNAWPSLIWHLYDYYLRPAGGYFGTKKACEPLHIQYSYDDASVVVVNSLYRPFPKLRASAKVYNLDLSEKFSKTAALDAAPDSSQKVFTVPPIDGLSATYFLKVSLEDADGKLLSSNFYWLSTKPDVSDWTKPEWNYTPISTYADLTGLRSLPPVHLEVSSRVERKSGEETTRVSVSNPTSHLAFFVHLRITKGKGGEEVLPILWEDNYFSLLPGDKREVAATYRQALLAGAEAVVEVDGWNVTPGK